MREEALSMRLSEAKIRYLAARLAAELESRDDVTFLGGGEPVALEIAKVIRENLVAEDALDRDVETTLGRYRREIAGGNLDVDLLRQKIKKQLAKERGVVI
jgi:hypothetical protein